MTSQTQPTEYPRPSGLPFTCTWRTEDGARRQLIVHADDARDARRGARDVAILRGEQVVPGSLAVQQVRR